MNINDVGYNVTIGEPVVDAKGVADSGLSFPCKAIPDGDYLVTLEVNGTVIAGRDKATFASGSATVGDYTLSYSSYAVSVATLTDDDVVVLRIEPLDVKVSDAFRAAVGKAAPAGGGSGGSAAEDEPLIGEKTVFSGVLGAYESLVPLGKACLLPDEWAAVSESLTDDELASIIVYVDGSATGDGYPYVLSLDGQHVSNTTASDVGKSVEIKIPAISPALINLYDPDSSDTETHYPDGAYDSDEGVFVLDVSAAYERLKRGQNVWIRYFDVNMESLLFSSVIAFYGNDDGDVLTMIDGYNTISWVFTNFNGTDDSGAENDQPPVNGNSES